MVVLRHFFLFLAPLRCFRPLVSADAISLQNITKRFGTVTAVDGISLTISAGEFFSLLGPSGCGKTTLLRLIAGLEQPDSGELHINGVSMLSFPPQKRPVNTVFQNYALFPHLKVGDNVAFGLRMRKTPSLEIERRVKSALDLVHISELRERFPHQISGGQKQRVALARALINEPAVLLLDEPLAAIDAKLRAELQTELKALQRQLRTTFIYVTHDQDEALSLSDRMAVLEKGRIAQIGTPRELYDAPRTRFVASFLGGCNLLHGTLESDGNGGLKVRTAIGLLRVSPRAGMINQGICLGIRRERVRLDVREPVENRVRGRIAEIAYAGSLTEYKLDLHGTELRARIVNRNGAPFEVDDTVDIQLPPEALFVLTD
jgi:spermidine/putrescine transport system ATP-binding protein